MGDCPCHGSRFDPLGKVVNGLAVAPLEEVKEEESAPSWGPASSKAGKGGRRGRTSMIHTLTARR